MIIQSSGVLNIGASGIKAAETQMAVSSDNIANANTQGFHRSDVVYIDRPNISGVDTTVVLSNGALAERARNDALITESQSQVVLDANTRLMNITERAQVGTAWNDFVSAVYDFRQHGTKAVLDAVNTAGTRVTQEYAAWNNAVGVEARQMLDGMKNTRVQYDALQMQILQTTDVTTKSALMEQLANVQGKLQGQGEIVVMIPQLATTANAAMQQAMKAVNAELGVNAFDIVSMQYQPGNVTGTQVASGSITSDTVSKAIGEVLQRVGQQVSDANTRLQVDTKYRQDAGDILSNEIGVNQTDETIKIKRAQQLYEAMAKIMAISSELFKSLLTI